MFNCQTGSFTVTAAGDRFCADAITVSVGRTIKKPYENHSEGREIQKVRYRDDK